MRLATNEMKLTLLYSSLLLLLIQVPAYFLYSKGQVGILLFALLILLVIITLWSGAVVGLISSLLFVFISGTLLLYMSFVGTLHMMSETLSIRLFFMYGIALFLLILCAGRIHELLVQESQHMQKLQRDLTRYVAVDVETGFDNETRMRLTANEEMRRADRYNQEFVFILLKLENYQQFEKLYGANETHHLWKSLAEKIQKTLRVTDKKFRYDHDKIALLLTGTSDAYIDTVYEKLDQALTNHELANGRWVTLHYKTSYFLYKAHTEQTFEELLGELEREMRTNEL